MIKRSTLSLMAVVGAAAVWAVQHQSGLRLRYENTALRRQVDQLVPLESKHQRLSNWVAQTRADPSDSQGQLSELARLRAEAAMLRQQAKELERPQRELEPIDAVAGHDGQSNSATNMDAAGGATEALNPDQRIDLTIGMEQLRDAGTDRIEAAAQTALWAVFTRDEQGLDRIRYRDPAAPETSATDRLHLLEGSLAQMADVSGVTITDWTVDGDLRRKVYFTANSTSDNPSAGRSSSGALVFRQVDGGWYLDRFEVYRGVVRRSAP